MSNLYLRNILIGILARLTMDILSGVSTKLRLIAPLSPRLIGRWLASVRRGQLLHSDIGRIGRITASAYQGAIHVPVARRERN